MAKTYLELVNLLRDRFNEVRLTGTGTWTTTVGFDQYTKDSINYAYHDILNAEMEWPFLHQPGTLKTTPGDQFYTITPTSPTGFTNPAEIKTIDWDKFYISPNETTTTITNETHTIPSSSPYIISVTQISSWSSDLGVRFTIGSIALTPVIGDPGASQYSITAAGGPKNSYVFGSADAGKSVQISYTTAIQPITTTITNPQYLAYIDYDRWYQTRLQQDKTGTSTNNSLPLFVFKTQAINELGLSPVPDKIYEINFEYWLDGKDLVEFTDTPLIPSHFQQIIIDGATKYCYEFREDAQMAQLADARFKAGIMRMRIEYINRGYTMSSGFNWARGNMGGYSPPFAF